MIAVAERDAPVAAPEQDAKVSVRNLCKDFTIGTGRATKRIQAVSDVSFDIADGETPAGRRSPRRGGVR